jgi:hypothetical protein
MQYTAGRDEMPTGCIGDTFSTDVRQTLCEQT